MWQWLTDVGGVLVALVICYGIGLIVRRRWLSRHGGTFELSWRARSTRPGRGWVLGIGRYSGDDLEWFRIFSLSPLPKRRWSRTDLEFVQKRQPEGPESLSLYSDHVVVICRSGAAPVEFAMSPESLMGLQAWLEAGPPRPRSVL